LSIVVVLGSLIYTHKISKKLALQEKERIEIWSNALSELSLRTIESPEDDVSFLFGIVERNNNIPAVLVNEEDKVIATTVKELDVEEYEEYYNKIKPEASAIEIETDYFLLVDSARRAEQNKVWVGMAKETAHQLGTPISSLMGWIESLKIIDDDPDSRKHILNELALDTERLQLIADRFSKIGSPPELEVIKLNALVKGYYDYLEVRAPKKIDFEFSSNFKETLIKGNTLLLSWVLENLMKNAIDAMGGIGSLKGTTELTSEKEIFIDISDTGKGISKGNMSKIFQPGFTTKKRGWGLGLSLTKRIIERYHSGKIFVLKSDMNVGTTFRVVLKNIKK